MCNNLAVVSKKGDFDNIVLKAKLALILGRNKGSRGTGIMHNGYRQRSKDYHYKNGIAHQANHDSLDFVEDLLFYEDGGFGNGFKSKPGYHVIMAHNRSPSTGMGSGEDFVHPFEYGEEYTVKNKEGKEITRTKNHLWFQHNGTITNASALAEKYGLKFSDYKNDSYLLGSLIFMGVDPAEIFEQYEGGCTCIWYWEKDRTLHVFKGGTLNTKGDLYEERPLYMYKTENQIWFNTQESILDVLEDRNYVEDNAVEDFPINEIMSIKDDLTITTHKVNRKIADKPVVNNYKPKITQRYNESTAVTKTVEYPDYRDGYNQMVWYRKLYYFNGRLAHGAYPLADSGVITKDATVYYFYEGMMLKDASFFHKACKGDIIYTNWYHKKALHSCNQGNMYTGHGKVTSKALDNIAFYPHGFKFDKSQIKKAEVYSLNSRATRKNPMPYVNPRTFTENYNGYYGTDFVTVQLCRKDYKERFGIKNISVAGWEADFCNICTNNMLIIEDPICEMYNELAETSWFTRFQCQQHFFNKEDISTVSNVDVRQFYAAFSPYYASFTEKELIKNLV